MVILESEWIRKNYKESKWRFLFCHLLTLEPKTINIVLASSPISLEHTCFWCPCLTTIFAIYHLNIGVQLESACVWPTYLRQTRNPVGHSYPTIVRSFLCSTFVHFWYGLDTPFKKSNLKPRHPEAHWCPHQICVVVFIVVDKIVLQVLS